MDSWLIAVIVILCVKAVIGLGFLCWLYVSKQRKQKEQARTVRQNNINHAGQQYPPVLSPQQQPAAAAVVVQTPHQQNYPQGWQEPPPAYPQVSVVKTDTHQATIVQKY